MSDSLERIRETRHFVNSAQRPKGVEPINIVVDGGITKQTSLACAQAGANVLVSGTYLFSAPDMAGAILELREGARAVFGKE
jgi:ribulose-phosphate 3-epimerase